MGLSSKSENLGIMLLMGCGSMGEKNVFYEEHGGCGPSWIIHLLGC